MIKVLIQNQKQQELFYFIHANDFVINLSRELLLPDILQYLLVFIKARIGPFFVYDRSGNSLDKLFAHSHCIVLSQNSAFFDIVPYEKEEKIIVCKKKQKIKMMGHLKDNCFLIEFLHSNIYEQIKKLQYQCDCKSRRKVKLFHLQIPLPKEKLSLKLKQFSKHEIQELISEKYIIIIYEGKLYDLTNFVGKHPGGAKLLIQSSGHDVTLKVKEFHNYISVEHILAKCFMGWFKL